MPNLIHWTQRVLEGSKIVLLFKIFKKMKKLLMSLSVVSVLALSVINYGYGQESLPPSEEKWVEGTLGGTSTMIWCTGSASNCTYKAL